MKNRPVSVWERLISGDIRPLGFLSKQGYRMGNQIGGIMETLNDLVWVNLWFALCILTGGYLQARRLLDVQLETKDKVEKLRSEINEIKQGIKSV